MFSTQITNWNYKFQFHVEIYRMLNLTLTFFISARVKININFRIFKFKTKTKTKKRKRNVTVVVVIQVQASNLVICLLFCKFIHSRENLQCFYDSKGHLNPDPYSYPRSRFKQKQKRIWCDGSGNKKTLTLDLMHYTIKSQLIHFHKH